MAAIYRPLIILAILGHRTLGLYYLNMPALLKEL